MKPFITIFSIIFITIFSLINPVQAQDFPRHIEYVYIGIVYDGAKYKENFYPQNVETIFILSDMNNVLEIKQTQVYYWPLTNEYKADWGILNNPIQGTLEVLKDSKLVDSIELVQYSKLTQDGISQPTGIVYGSETGTIYDTFLKDREQYYNTLFPKYQDELRAYQEAAVENLGHAINKEPLVEIIPPINPSPPNPTVSEPSKGFILRLQPGHYLIQVRGTDGNVIPGTQKTLEVFSGLRTGVFYEIIPESQWTNPVSSEQPDSDIYWSSESVLYVKPYSAVEYPYDEFFYLTNPQSIQLNSNDSIWVQGDPITNCYIELSQHSQLIQSIYQKDYLVSQFHGSGLGYSISEFEEWTEKNEKSTQIPSFRAIKLDMNMYPSVDTFRLKTIDGELITNSERRIHRLNPLKMIITIILSLSPLALGGIIIWRRRHLTS